ncbi:helix-turn-helix domain-containing protein [Aquibaculum arenosum]|uniref:Helix-turn-helix domain-containing protein n=1 Tax=Aquibaculum arenosum TaxID=3032591 RepID=A0ABT5YQB3_9PROT|nr:helix-turn-helix domain-containing protein [Fodinicurvata sp. CAU 1616]MDF2097170.1 helix-turn-helix domain-containing protein [Fodinicurvata sp. CAU 1616]
MVAEAMPNAASSRGEADLARDSLQRLARVIQPGETLTLRAGYAAQESTIELPAEAVKLLAEILESMASGRPVSVMHHDAELTTQQAAELLHVSRPFLVQLLEERKIPFRKVGTHRRVRFDDVMRYKEAIDADRRKVLNALAAEAQELDMGY